MEPTSPGSAGTRKRKTAHTAAPLALRRPRSPMERLRAADAADEDDLDNFRTHKRYLTEVGGPGLPFLLCARRADLGDDCIPVCTQRVPIPALRCRVHSSWPTA